VLVSLSLAERQKKAPLFLRIVAEGRKEGRAFECIEEKGLKALLSLSLSLLLTERKKAFLSPLALALA